MAKTTAQQTEHDLLGIYLNDHLAGATGGVGLGIPVRGYKVYAGWAGVKAGRVKLNGHLLTRSPLSALEETELLRLGVEGKAAGWRSLRSLAKRDDRLDADRFDELLDRAKRRSDTLETLRVAAAERVLTTPAGGTP